MKHTNRSALGALITGTVIASVLATIGCADGKRGASNKGRRMFRNAQPNSVGTNGINGKGGTNGTLVGATGTSGVNGAGTPAPALAVDPAAAKIETQIAENVDGLVKTITASPKPDAGEYALVGVDSHVRETNDGKSFASAMTSYDFEAKSVVGESLSSGTFEGAAVARDLKIAGKITVDANGVFAAKAGAGEGILRATAERSKTKLVINVQELAPAQASPDALSIIDLLNGKPSDRVKVSVKSASPEKGLLLIWISEEKLADATKDTGKNSVRNFFLTFETAEFSAAQAAKAPATH